MRLIETIRFRRGKLPHWEVRNGRYFVTVRLADSLPWETVQRLQEIHRSLASVEPRSTAFIALQRQFFRMMEKYLDAHNGACLLREPQAAAILTGELEALADWAVAVPHFTIMPNHCHALLAPAAACSHSLDEIMKRLKGRTGLRIRAATNTSGPLWQREWFDHWIRDDHEWNKTVVYIRENPVKARLVATWPEHPWTR